MISQVAQLQEQLLQKHLLLGPGDLPQNNVTSLESELVAKASTSALTSGQAQKEDIIQVGGLAQDKVGNSVTEFATKATKSALTSGLARSSRWARTRQAGQFGE